MKSLTKKDIATTNEWYFRYEKRIAECDSDFERDCVKAQRSVAVNFANDYPNTFPAIIENEKALLNRDFLSEMNAIVTEMKNVSETFMFSAKSFSDLAESINNHAKPE